PHLGAPVIPGASAGAWWLAAAHPSAAQVWREWSTAQRLAMIPAGYRWDALKLPTARLADITGADAPWRTAPLLVDSPVERAYILVPPGTAATWDVPGTSCLGRGFWISVANPVERRQPDCARWHTPPTAHPTLADPAALRAALTARTTP
ncbi:hypothetical protein AB0O77_25400, partial [Streptomyces albidoflavus]|uniref:hypothetical protein n=1 Tax=Streptomyces albidoflavus TaxID=1886 RepID=UPI003421A6BC